jgi:hypothetical protein
MWALGVADGGLPPLTPEWAGMAGAGPAQTSTTVTVSRWWHAVVAAVILASLAIQLVLIFTGGADANSGQTGQSTSLGVRLWRLFSYFTIQSNLIVLASALLLAISPLRDGRIWRVVRLDALLASSSPGWCSRSFSPRRST